MTDYESLRKERRNDYFNYLYPATGSWLDKCCIAFDTSIYTLESRNFKMRENSKNAGPFLR